MPLNSDVNSGEQTPDPVIEPYDLLDRMSDGFFALDMDWRFTYVNPRASVILRNSASQLLGRSFWDSLPEIFDGFGVDAFRRARRDRQTVRFDTYDPVHSRWFDTCINPSETGVSVLMVDISDRRATRDVLAFQANLLDAVEQIVIATDMTNAISYWNRYAELLTGWSDEDVRGRHIREILVPLPTTDDEDDDEDITAGTRWSGECLIRHREGRFLPVEGTISPLFDDNGRLTGAVSTLTDISERKITESALMSSEARYRSLIERMPAVTFSAEGGIGATTAYISPQIDALTGYAPSEWLINPGFWLRITHAEDRERLLAAITHTNTTGEPFALEFRVIRRDGRTIWVRVEAALLPERDQDMSIWQGFVVDITDRKALEEQLVHSAFHDALTDLPNRAMFLDRTRQALARAHRVGHLVAVLILDLDNFKMVNDSFGHVQGDRLLIQVARRLQRSTRVGETITRMGGDEFAVLLDEVRTIDEVVHVAERLLRSLQQPFNLDSGPVVVTASIGIVTSDARHAHAEHLLRDADIALFRAKDAGEHSFIVFEESMHAAVRTRLELESALRRAIDRNEFVLLYQPKVALNSGEVVGVEALLRWQRAGYGLVSPETFIDVSEQSGLIHPIGAWVLREACRQGTRWQQAFTGTGDFVVSVNLSSRQFSQPDLVEQVEMALTDAALPGRCLSLEITETVVMDDAELAVDRLRNLKRLGVELGVDDFGTGYSSLTYLKRFPVDVLKIDRSFISGIGREPEDTAIVATTIMMAHALGLDVVAEGIETPEQMHLIRDLGCDRAQGYYFSRPVPADQIDIILAESTGSTGSSNPLNQP